jgi:GNAT superfamily N-acetyltransferase
LQGFRRRSRVGTARLKIVMSPVRVRVSQPAQASETARVFVTTLGDTATIVGYYALAAAHVAPSDATARALKGQPPRRPVPAILLARLAVNERHQRSGVGRSLLQDALLRCAQAAKTIGARVLLVHARHDAARDWYLKYGFEPSPTDPLHLQLLMNDIRRLLKRAK